MKRAIVIVMDGCGAGEAPDSAKFGDADHPATIRHVWEACGGLMTPSLAKIGFLSACKIEGQMPGPNARYGRLRELSQGKDSVTGHWEMMGVLTESPFPTYPNGFPPDLVAAFEKEIGSHVLGNKAASGTEIIAELGAEHVRTKRPILYTSADSVFQIACHEEVVPIERLYEICEIGRRLCVAPNNVQRVIARPFVGNERDGFTRTGRRKDFPLPAPPNAIDDIGDAIGIGVIPELFGGRGFRPGKRTQNNAEHASALLGALDSDARFIFANFEDFDMLYGHRNDPKGFGKALEDFDQVLGAVLDRLKEGDLLLITADHGNDPTSASTDHSREYVPICLAGPNISGKNLGDVDGMDAVGATVLSHLGIASNLPGTALI